MKDDGQQLYTQLPPIVFRWSSVAGGRWSSGRRCRLALSLTTLAALSTLAARPAADLADLDVGGLEGVAVLRAERHDLLAGFDIAQLPVHLLAHCAVGG